MDSSNPEKENKNPDGNNSRKRDAGSRSSSTDGQNGTVASVGVAPAGLNDCSPAKAKHRVGRVGQHTGRHDNKSIHTLYC